MTTTRASATLAFAATALAGLTALSGIVAAPIAHADTVSDIIATAQKDRHKYAPQCPQFDTPSFLFDTANRIAAMKGDSVDALFPSFVGRGNREASALNAAYRAGFGPALSNCKYTSLAVAFLADTDADFGGGGDSLVVLVVAP